LYYNTATHRAAMATPPFFTKYMLEIAG